VCVCATHSISECIFWGNTVDFFNGVWGHVLTGGLTVIDHKHLIVLFIGCKNQEKTCQAYTLCIHKHIQTAEMNLLVVVWPLTCLMQRRAYLRVWSVLARPLLRLSGGRWYFSSFRDLKSSFWVLAFADSSLLQSQHTCTMTQLLIPLNTHCDA